MSRRSPAHHLRSCRPASDARNCNVYQLHQCQYDADLEALEAIFHSIENSDEWSVVDASASDQLARRRTILKNRFGWEKDTAYADSDELWTDFKGGALDRHARHFGKVHRSYGKGIGLISKRATNKLRYAPNDAFLKAIILANVKERMEFGVFLEQIYQRYGLVFGETHANVVLQSKDIDIKPFRANTLRLEQRLGNLGLLRRLYLMPALTFKTRLRSHDQQRPYRQSSRKTPENLHSSGCGREHGAYASGLLVGRADGSYRKGGIRSCIAGGANRATASASVCWPPRFARRVLDRTACNLLPEFSLRKASLARSNARR